MPSDTAIRIIDSARAVAESASEIKKANVATVIRYYAREGGQWCGKVLSESELEALNGAGLSVAIVFQDNNSQADFFYDEDKKIEDVKWALEHAKNLKQPQQTAIYFGADFDLDHRRKRDSSGNFIKKPGGGYELEGSKEIRATNERALQQYFEHAQQELGKRKYKVGVYGCGATCELLGGGPGKPKLADYFWISASVSYAGTSSFYNSRKWHLFQNKVDLASTFVPRLCQDDYGRKKRHADDNRVIDTNVLNDRFEDFGQWRRDGSMPPHPGEASKLVLANRAFSNKASATVYSKPSRSAPAVGKVLYARNVRVLDRVGDYVGISTNESDQILGYCEKGDLNADLTTMPPWPRPRGA